MIIKVAKMAILFISLITFIFADTETDKKVDTTVFLTVDLTGEGKNDTIFCHLTGESWKKPLTVTYKIKSKNQIVFKTTSSNEDFDENFGKADYFFWCKEGNYLACKKRWYFELMDKEIIKTVKLNDKRSKRLLDTTSNLSIPRLVEKLYIDSLGYTKQKAAKVAKKLAANLKKRDFVCLVLPPHPVYKSFPQFYDPNSKKLILLFGY